MLHDSGIFVTPWFMKTYLIKYLKKKSGKRYTMRMPASAICGIAWACWAISPRRAYGLIYWPLLELALFSLLAHSHCVVLSSGSPHTTAAAAAIQCHYHHLWHQCQPRQCSAVQPVAHHSGQVRMDFTAAGLKAHDEVKRRRGCPPADATHDGMYASRQQDPKKQHI